MLRKYVILEEGWCSKDVLAEHVTIIVIQQDGIQWRHWRLYIEIKQVNSSKYVESKPLKYLMNSLLQLPHSILCYPEKNSMDDFLTIESTGINCCRTITCFHLLIIRGTWYLFYSYWISILGLQSKLSKTSPLSFTWIWWDLPNHPLSYKCSNEWVSMLLLFKDISSCLH